MTIEIKREPVLIPIEDSLWKTSVDFNFTVNEREYTIPKGFISNLASTPRFIWMFLPPATGRYRVPSLIHDYMYDCGGDRAYCDTVYYYCMLKYDVPNWKAKIIYTAVKWFGKSHFNDQNRNLYK